MKEKSNLKNNENTIRNLIIDGKNYLKLDSNIAFNDSIERGKKDGKLSIQEVAVALNELDFDSEQVTKLYEKLEQDNIELVDDLEDNVEIDLSLDIETNS
ncbi:MAG: RNA polymerase sigma factor region1.1 domain-containing protein, partial [Mycoplasma sp.]